MKKLLFLGAFAFFALTVSAQSTEAPADNKAKTEQTCSKDAKKASCSKDKAAGCCSKSGASADAKGATCSKDKSAGCCSKSGASADAKGATCSKDKSAGCCSKGTAAAPAEGTSRRARKVQEEARRQDLWLVQGRVILATQNSERAAHGVAEVTDTLVVRNFVHGVAGRRPQVLSKRYGSVFRRQHRDPPLHHPGRKAFCAMDVGPIAQQDRASAF